jgi:hypothetical protein
MKYGLITEAAAHKFYEDETVCIILKAAACEFHEAEIVIH